MNRTYLVTGSAGFIGFHLTRKLLDQGHFVVGIDNLNAYCSLELKQARQRLLEGNPRYSFHQIDLADKARLKELCETYAFTSVFHLAGQAGVRYSLENPGVYLESNVAGTLNVLEAVRRLARKPHVLMASSSSVYGLSENYPYRETEAADRPVSLYGATKRAAELICHSYAHLYHIPVTVLRFFTVYGPWGRPDMAPYKFVDAISKGGEIEVYNNGDMVRDFTYVDDVVDGTLALDEARRKEATDTLFETFNIGCSSPRNLMEFICCIENALKTKARLKMMPFQAGDVHQTFADVEKLKTFTGHAPRVPLETGVEKFVAWYKSYYA